MRVAFLDMSENRRKAYLDRVNARFHYITDDRKLDKTLVNSASALLHSLNEMFNESRFCHHDFDQFKATLNLMFRNLGYRINLKSWAPPMEPALKIVLDNVRAAWSAAVDHLVQVPHLAIPGFWDGEFTVHTFCHTMSNRAVDKIIKAAENGHLDLTLPIDELMVQAQKVVEVPHRILDYDERRG